MNDPQHDPWNEQDAGPVVRLYALTRGRGRTARTELSLDTMVVDAGTGLAPRRTEPEYVEIVRLCRRAQSVAEVSAQLGIPLTLTKVLIGDLIDDGRLAVRAPADRAQGETDLGVLQMIANSLRGS